MENFVEIKNDLFNIASRLKQIDKHYILVRNLIKKRFELWYDACIPHLELVFKNNKIDSRMIDFVNETRIQNLDKIIKQMDEMNEKIKEKEISKAKDECVDKLSEVIKYVNK